ncbi:glucose-6-phosphate 1-epimerase [Pyrus ussuriensis x Pyrus communis]|uniref:Glucose-6-phosphate 1-epimerase n=1 Tax=Pyrus ussuriensis x Pyrus communis TaxID=2448454 RepID=A0A5N5HKS4_9ROSA|nr:glucose-6-phosphate 1-epimerase [Pyrus ussuriensis x Pyrus communis]
MENFFEIGHKDGVGQLRSRYSLFDASSKGDHKWARDTLKINGEWESDSSLELRFPTKFIDGKRKCKSPWAFLLSNVSGAIARWEKGGLPPMENIKWIKEEQLSYLIVVVEHVASKGGKKRSSSLVQESPAETKLKTSSAACGGTTTAKKCIIKLSSTTTVDNGRGARES